MQALRKHCTILYEEIEHPQTWGPLGIFVPIFHRHQEKKDFIGGSTGKIFLLGKNPKRSM